MAGHSLELGGNQVRLPVLIVDAVDHGVFKGNPAAGFFEIVVAGIKQFLHVVSAVYRHDLGAGLAVRRMEGHRQCQLQSQVCQTVDTGNHAAGRQRDVPHPDIHAVRVVHKFQETKHRIQVIHGLANAHQHNVADLKAGVQLGKQHLVQHFRRRQVPDLPGNRGGTESTPHPAPHLGGDTYCIAVVIAHQDRLDAVAVRQLP